MGASRFTSPIAINRQLKEGRSRVCVFTEAGLLLGAGGDAQSIARVILGLYSQSAFGDVSGVEEYSLIEKSIGALASPALSIVNEATPETLLTGFRANGSLEMGYIPRQSIFRIHGLKPYPNINVRSDISQPCKARLQSLIGKSLPFQTSDDKVPVKIVPESADLLMEMMEHSKRCVDLYNEFLNVDLRKSLMSTRAHVKALKYAGVCAAFNNSTNSASDGISQTAVGRIYITREIWEWAKNLSMYEIEGVESFFGGSGIGGNSVYDT
jgi:hypothetical protein